MTFLSSLLLLLPSPPCFSSRSRLTKKVGGKSSDRPGKAARVQVKIKYFLEVKPELVSSIKEGSMAHTGLFFNCVLSMRQQYSERQSDTHRNGEERSILENDH